MRRLPAGLLVIALVLVVASNCSYGQGGKTQYVYDANGRLAGVIAPNGSAAIYRYDPAGNLTSIEQVPVGTVSVLSFSPTVGTIGDQVTLTGTGLDTVSTVSFNGVPGQITAASANSLTALVPSGATTGPISVAGANGNASGPGPFTVVARVDIVPTLAVVLPNEMVQFHATVVGTSNQQVTWAVNGVANGSSTVGTISATGLYTAPNINNGLAVTVTATSQTDAAVAGQATVRILNPNTTSEVRSAGLVVARGVTTNNTAAARPVSVARSFFANDFVAAHAVLVQKGTAIPAVAHSVAVEVGGLVTLFSRPVSTTTGPVITAVSPGTLTHGTAATVTLTGKNLGGTTAVLFQNSNGVPDTAITVTNISVSSDGTSLTFTATLGTNASLGTDVISVTAAAGQSQTTNIGTNTVQIQ